MAVQKKVQKNSKSKDEMRREQYQKRKKRNKRKRIVFYTVLILILIIVALVLSFTVFFNVSKITVSGKTKYETSKIIKASGINVGDNLFLINRDKAAESIEKKLPYIGTVTFDNKLPNGIEIVVVQTKVECAVSTGSTYALCDGNGKVLEVGKKEVAEGITVIKGATANGLKVGQTIKFKSDECMNAYNLLMQEFEKNKITNITEINLTDVLNMSMVYDSRIIVKIGSKSNLAKKIEMAANVFKKQDEISKNQKGTLDLTIEKKAYFTPNQETGG